jgi:hypothetical protein
VFLKRLFILKSFIVLLIIFGAFQMNAMEEDLKRSKIGSLSQELEFEKDVFSIVHKKYEDAYWLRFELKEEADKAKKIFEKSCFNTQTHNFVHVGPTEPKSIEYLFDSLTYNGILQKEDAEAIIGDLKNNKNGEEKKKIFGTHEFLKSITYNATKPNTYYVEIVTKKSCPTVQKQLKEKGFWADSDTFFVCDLTILKKRVETFLDVFVEHELIQKTTLIQLLNSF